LLAVVVNTLGIEPEPEHDRAREEQ